MPRQARLDAPGVLHHIMIRGIERRKIFINDGDRRIFWSAFRNSYPKLKPPVTHGCSSRITPISSFELVSYLFPL